MSPRGRAAALVAVARWRRPGAGAANQPAARPRPRPARRPPGPPRPKATSPRSSGCCAAAPPRSPPGRPRAYAATATGPQRDRDREAARNARGLGLRDVELAVDSADVSGRGATLRVRSLYGVRGVRGRFGTARRVDARRTPAGWRVRAESSRRERHPWEVGPVAGAALAALRRARAGARSSSARCSTRSRAATRAWATVLRRPRLRRRYLVVVAGGTQAARSLTERIRGVESLAAISDTEVQEAGAAQRVSAVVSQRLVVVWPPFSTLDADGQQRVVTHELTHAALAGVTSGRTPAWLIEGVGALRLRGPPRRRGGERHDASAASARDAHAPLEARRDRAAAAATARRPPTPTRRRRRSTSSSASAAQRFLRLYDAFNDEGLPGRAGAERDRPRRPAHARHLAAAARARPRRLARIS